MARDIAALILFGLAVGIAALAALICGAVFFVVASLIEGFAQIGARLRRLIPRRASSRQS